MGSDVSFRGLRVFVVLAEELHFGRAAARLHVTQPALTRTIQAVEAALEVQLLDRSTRRVRLTPAGVVLAEEGRRLLSMEQSMRDRVLEAAEGRARTVRLGVIESASLTRMPAVLSEFRRRHPEVHLNIHDLHSTEQLDRLRDHEIDWGLLRAPVSDPAFESAIVYDDPLVAAVPADAYDGAPRIPLRELERTPLVLYHQSLGPGFMATVVGACAQIGFAPRVTRRADSTAMLLSLVSEGAGIGIVSEAVATTRAEGVRFVGLDDPTPSSTVLLVWRAGESTPELRALLEILRDTSYDGIG